ncbi:MAG: chemotaxis protein CheB [Gammaproteobacteria bacterium]|nr:chemotaxis protein CheB [Gammaproteobacteria bacterium]
MNEDFVRVVIIGTSWGGLDALDRLLSKLPVNFLMPILIVQHRHRLSDNHLNIFLDKRCALHVKEAQDKEKIIPATVYIAPANYHLLVERDFSLSLSAEAPINYSRPSIDLLFETAAEAFHEKTIGIVLTGANSDGAQGMKLIKEYGGFTMVQLPETAEAPAMPKAVIELVDVDFIATIDDIAQSLIELNTGTTIFKSKTKSP